MEIVVALKPGRHQVFRYQVKCGTQVHGESALGVAAADEHHRAAARVLLAREQVRVHAVLFLVALEEQAQLVVADLADKAGRHPENGRAGNRVGGRAAGHIFHAQGLESLPDAVSGRHVHVLHAPLREMELREQGIIRQNGQDVRQGIAYSEYRFHILQK